MATATKTSRSLKVTCPLCLDSDGTVMLDLNDLRTCSCSACGNEFSIQVALTKAAEMLARWQAVANWADSAPAE